MSWQKQKTLQSQVVKVPGTSTQRSGRARF
jgi:hypothetical protein